MEMSTPRRTTRWGRTPWRKPSRRVYGDAARAKRARGSEVARPQPGGCRASRRPASWRKRQSTRREIRLKATLWQLLDLVVLGAVMERTERWSGRAARWKAREEKVAVNDVRAR